MSFIIDFLKEVASVITFVFDFVFWLVESIIETIVLGVTALANVTFYVTQFPTLWIAPFVAIVTIGIIFKIKG